jgi:hypothetical protein
MAKGVPGMPIRMEANMPPVSPPTYTPSMVDSPSMGLMPKVNGSASTTAMVIVKPGMEPAIKPPMTPRAISIKLYSAKTSPKADARF